MVVSRQLPLAARVHNVLLLLDRGCQRRVAGRPSSRKSPRRTPTVARVHTRNIGSVAPCPTWNCPFSAILPLSAIRAMDSCDSAALETAAWVWTLATAAGGMEKGPAVGRPFEIFASAWVPERAQPLTSTGPRLAIGGRDG